MDLTFRTEYGRFNYRVGAIIMSGDEILMVKNTRADYYYSVGGRVKFGETAEEAVLREVYEETGKNLEIEKLAVIHENFFRESEFYHELSFFFLLKDAGKFTPCGNSTDEKGSKESLEWLPLGKIENIKLFPDFFKTMLTEIRSADFRVRHIITKDK